MIHTFLNEALRGGQTVFAYGRSGSTRSENSATGPARVGKARENSFAPPGTEHLVSEKAKTVEPASLFAGFVAHEGARLTVPSTA